MGFGNILAGGGGSAGRRPTGARRMLKPPSTNLNINVLEMWINDTLLEAETGENQQIRGPKVGIFCFMIERKKYF
jgi:hypothetical protein